MRQITTKHLKACSDGGVDALDKYKNNHPDSKIMTSISKQRHTPSEEEKRKQSEKMKQHFSSPEGQKTREIISKTSKKRVENGYREQAAEHLRELNQKPEQRELLRKKTKERWEEDGDLRRIVPEWHEENKELSNKMAAHARDHIQKKNTSLHREFKERLEKEGIQTLSEYKVEYYHIDEAIPNFKLAIEVDGCYWHSCDECGFDGPDETDHYDKRKESYLGNRGWTILRFWGHEIKNNFFECVEKINNTINSLQLSEEE